MDGKWSSTILTDLMDAAGTPAWNKWKADRKTAGLPVVDSLPKRHESSVSVLADFPVLRIHLDQHIVDLTQRLCIQRARVPDQYLSKYTVILWLFIGGIFCPRILNAKDFSN